MDSLEENFTNNISKISFIFVVFLVVAGGYVTQIFSCSTQRFLSSNISGKHLIGIGLIFISIMLEGGFNLIKMMVHPVDWSNGNCFDSMIYAVLIYAIFLFSSKTRLGWNTAFFTFIYFIYYKHSKII